MKALMSAMGVLGLAASASASQPLVTGYPNDFGRGAACALIGDCVPLPKPLPDPYPHPCTKRSPFPKPIYSGPITGCVQISGGSWSCVPSSDCSFRRY